MLTQESKRLASSSEEVMLARLWDSTERQTLTREKEDVEAGKRQVYVLVQNSTTRWCSPKTRNSIILR